MSKKADILFVLDSGIGNSIQAMYAVELCIENGLNAQVYMGSVNSSFQDYLSSSYGSDVVLRSMEGVSCQHLVHSFLFEREDALPEHDHYYYLAGDSYYATKYKSEAELYIELVSGIFGLPKTPTPILNKLVGEFSDRVLKLNADRKYVLYPGGSAINPVRRWPNFSELITSLGGDDNVIIIGSEEDVDFRSSYMYPSWLGWVPQAIKNRKRFFRFCKGLGLLKKHAHWKELEALPNAYLEVFNWSELVAIFRSCKAFVGNDGGLMHLAGAAGANGVALFGPSSVTKNRSFNDNIKPIVKEYNCIPCQFGVGGVQMVKGFINCPYQVKCLKNITVQETLTELAPMLVDRS